MTNGTDREVRAPLVIRGVGVGRGIAIGPLRFGHLKSESRLLRAEMELRRLERALRYAGGEISAMEDRAVRSVGEEHGEIYRLLRAELDRGEYVCEIRERIKGGESLEKAAEEAEKTALNAAAKGGREEKAAAARAKELRNILIAACEEGGDEADGDTEKESRGGDDEKKYILVASDCDGLLSGGKDAGNIIGIVSVGGTEGVGLGAYARSKGIPAIMISAADAPMLCLEGSGAIIDPERGRLTVNPDLAALDRFAESSREAEAREERLAGLIGLPSVTRSGRHVPLLATVDGAADIPFAISSDAEGIGLLMTESVGRESEERQYEEYKSAVEGFEKGGVTFRLYSGQSGIRLLHKGRDILKTQLRALLRAAAYGWIGIAVSFAVSPEEIRRLKAVMIETAGELKGEGVAFGDRVSLGAVIDTPAAAICGEKLAEEVDFFIADGDRLTSLALAADQGDPSMAELIRRNPQPALRLIEEAARAIHGSGSEKRMGAFGAVAIDRSLTETLLSAGVDYLSLPPPCILDIRERVRECPE